MYSEKYIMEMVDSYNCLRLDNKHVFQVEVYEDKDRQKFFELGNTKIPFVNLGVGQLAKFISVQEKFEVSKLWKVDVDKSKLNPGSTDDDIKELGGVSMEFECDFINYFREDCELADNIHIVATTTTGSRLEPPKTFRVRDIIDNITKDLIERNPEPLDELDMPLQQRDFNSAMRKIRETIYSNIVGRKDKSNYWCLASGGAPGIGKTRFGQELFNCVKEHLPQHYQDLGYRDSSDKVLRRWTNIHFEYIYMDFGNGCGLDDDYDYKLNAEVIIGLRIAYAFFINKKYQMEFREFCLKVESFGDKVIELFNVYAVIRYFYEFLKISDEQQLFLYIHIDEFQIIDSWDKKTNRSVFYNMIRCLSAYMISSDIFVQPFFSGTALHAVTEHLQPSGVSFEFVSCPLLDITSMIRIMDHFAGKFQAKVRNRAYEWKSCYPISQLLMDTGGLPRALQQLFVTIFGKYGKSGKAFFENLTKHNYNSIFEEVKWGLNHQYKIESYISDQDNHEVAVLL